MWHASSDQSSSLLSSLSVTHAHARMHASAFLPSTTFLALSRPRSKSVESEDVATADIGEAVVKAKKGKKKKKKRKAR